MFEYNRDAHISNECICLQYLCRRTMTRLALSSSPGVEGASMNDSIRGAALGAYE
jgi:hypothetical protein